MVSFSDHVIGFCARGTSSVNEEPSATVYLTSQERPAYTGRDFWASSLGAGRGPHSASSPDTVGIVVRQLPGTVRAVRSIGGYGMATGTIARLLIDKGFGFIRDESGLEHFFHRSSVRGAVFELLREGQRVEFSVEDSQKGPRAGDVRLIEG